MKSIREAKARYYDALSELRKKDGLYREAEAALKQAEAALKQAETAHQQAVTDAYKKLKELEIELKSLENQQKAEEVKQEIDKIKKAMEIAEKQHEIDLVNKQAALANAQETLRVTLRDIALKAQDLTAQEKAAVAAAIDAYLDSFDKVADQKIKVMRAEKAVADAQRAKEVGQYNPDYGWDNETHAYLSKIELYNRAIERAKGFIAEDEEALKNIPAFEDVEKWAEELVGYKETADKLEYSRHTLTQEAAAYYVQHVHDGVKAYNDEVEAWENANPAVAAPGAKPSYTEGTPTYTTKNKITIGGMTYPAGTTFGAALTDSVALPTLDVKTTPAYAKFSYILDKYTTLTSPVNETDKILATSPKYLLVANQLMKDFILGTEMGNVGTQKFSYKKEDGTQVDLVADYGLKGAVSVLKRDKVLNPDTPADPAAARAAADEAKSAWQADRDTLAAGLLKYQPYLDAKAALEAALANANANGDAMVKAIETMVQKLASINTGISTHPYDYNANDTITLVESIVEFAKTREKYLDYSNVTAADPDSNTFVYALASNPPTVGTVKFSDLDKKSTGPSHYTNYTFFTKQDRNTFGENGAVAFQETDGMAYTNPYGNGHEAFIRVIEKLVGTGLATKIAAEDVIVESEWETLINNGTNYTAFYNTYKYVAKTATEPAKITYADGSPYTPKEISDAEAALQAAIDAYKACYERYWNDLWPATIVPTMTDEEIAAELEAHPDININSYTLATFTEPFIIVNSFTGANNWDKTNAILAILGSVDKNAGGVNAPDIADGTKESVVLGTAAKPTDLNKYLYAEYLYQLALNPASGDIKVIEEWVAAVEKAFTDGAAAAVAEAKAAYEADLNVYNNNKDKYDKYQEKLKAFTGVDGNGVALGLRKITGAYADVASIQYQFELVNVPAGEWIKKLGGKQLELAEKYFPEFPAKLKDWYVRNEKISDEIAHNNILIAALNPVYAASAKIIGHTDYPTWQRNGSGEIEEGQTDIYNADFIQLVSNYKAARKAYENAIKQDIKDQNVNIDTNMKLIADFESGAAAADIAIAEAQATLDKEMRKLAVLEDQLAQAKESLDKILEYIKTLDSNFVIPQP